ncbi:hypothetical protein C8R45DRAFT_1073940 [Mycena sanguinolenta]|nr:hypothetical protein C8R45DRAFT_1073940 [Mycena sanguinolenta]
MFSTLPYSAALWLSFSVCVSALAPAAPALAPRASDSPIAYYRPPWQCPESYNVGGKAYPVIVSAVRKAKFDSPTDVLSCQTTTDKCSYNLKTGLVQIGQPAWCDPNVEPYSGCAYECPVGNGIAQDYLVGAGSLKYTSDTTNLDSLVCNYGTDTPTGGSVDDATCTYDFVAGTVTPSGANKAAEKCQGPLSLDCGSTPTRRRRYRGEDNFTAMLARRVLRERESAAPEPAERPSPKKSLFAPEFFARILLPISPPFRHSFLRKSTGLTAHDLTP